MTKEELLEKANSLPLAPGVYLMHDKEGTVIYVGKAKRLKNRVSQYFQAGRGHNLKTQTMVKLVQAFDTIVVGSEFEALVLENALIKQYMPRYNILLKDDKGYPFVRLSREQYRRFSLVSRVADDGARYFGPYGGRLETRSALDAIRAALHLPTCSRTFPRAFCRLPSTLMAAIRSRRAAASSKRRSSAASSISRSSWAVTSRILPSSNCTAMSTRRSYSSRLISGRQNPSHRPMW